MPDQIDPTTGAKVRQEGPEPIDESTGKVKEKSPMSWADRRAIATLLVLYFLQGVPMGVCAAMPMIFQDANMSDADQGKFSFASWPFSLKILWAPIVDAVFSLAVGRRKSWVIPSQFIIALLLFTSSLYIESLLDESVGGGIQINIITGIFFVLFFFCATQDVAVDGWALTMLSEKNVGYGSVCNSIGQTLGNYVAYLLHAYNIVSLPEAMRFWAYLFLITTILVLLFKPEKTPKGTTVESIAEAYRGMGTILKLKHVRSLLVVMLLVKSPFVIVEGLSSLRLQAHGMPKATIANIGLLTAPVSLLLPAFINPGKNVLNLFKRNFIPRLVLGITFPILVHYTPSEWSEPMPYVFLALVALLSMGEIIVSMNMFVAQMAYFNRISDDAMGGTYMTLLNTFANLGYKLPSSIGYFLVDFATSYICVDGSDDATTAVECREAGGRWEKEVDGYYSCSVLFFIGGVVLWFCYLQRTITTLQNVPIEDWKIKRLED
eukprot:INCI15997.1.p1 GENE.INCI15997.1~~INCI15997.1.p1  ORF type:complete len:491 (+),score=86.37 INCI15997.1:234-1706(+)